MAITPDVSAQVGISEDARTKMALDAMRAKVAPGKSKEAKLKEACQGFEAVFIGQMLKEMRKTVPKDGLLHNQHEDQYLSMFDEELARSMAKNGGMGLADFMESQLKGDMAHKTSHPVSKVGDHQSMAVNSLPRPAPSRKIQDVIKAPQSQTQQTIYAPGFPGSTLAGTPSQHLGLPGAAYLKGQDKNLAEAAPGPMTQPVDGAEVSSDFGWRQDPITHQRSFHSGVDLAAPAGTPVKACWAGKVAFAGVQGGYGNLVIVDHGNGWQSYYGHNSANRVSVGQEVSAGQQIAAVGMSGRATGPHVHFELRRGQETVDPMKLGGASLALASPAPR